MNSAYRFAAGSIDRPGRRSISANSPPRGRRSHRSGRLRGLGDRAGRVARPRRAWCWALRSVRAVQRRGSCRVRRCASWTAAPVDLSSNLLPCSGGHTG